MAQQALVVMLGGHSYAAVAASHAGTPAVAWRTLRPALDRVDRPEDTVVVYWLFYWG